MPEPVYWSAVNGLPLLSGPISKTRTYPINLHNEAQRSIEHLLQMDNALETDEGLQFLRSLRVICGCERVKPRLSKIVCPAREQLHKGERRRWERKSR